MAASASTVFVARSAELAVLRRHHADARAGRPQTVLVEGAAGVGKTSLVREFLGELGDVNVIRATADEGERSVTYGLLAQVVGALSRARLRRSPALSSGPSPGADPLVVGAELACQLGMLDAILVVEDLHWADVASSEALLLAARRLRRERVLVLVTCRGEELARLGGRWERFAAADDRCTRIALMPFRNVEVIELAEAMYGSRLARPAAERLVDHTAGNPLYVRALLEELPATTLLAPSGPLPAPRSLSGVVVSRLSQLPRPARELVVVAAVMGRTAPLQTAAELAGIDDPADALETAQAARLLLEVPGTGGREVSFPHPLVHAAVYGDIGPARRRALHRAAAAVLTDASGALEHRVAAAIGPDAQLADDLEAAGNEDARRRDLSAAAAHFEDASDLSETRPARERRLVSSVAFLLQAGDVASAGAHRSDLENCEVSGQRQYVLGQMAFLGGQAIDGEQLLQSAWQLRRTGDIDSALAAALILGESYLLSRPPGEAAVVLQDAFDICPLHHPLKAVLAAELCGAQGVGGRGRDGLEMLARYMTADASTSPPDQLDAVILRALTRFWCEDLDGSLDDLRGTLRRAHEGVSGHRLTQALAYRSEAEFRLGRWDDSVLHAEQAVRDAHDAERAWAYPFIHSQASLPYAARGDWVAAQHHVDVARDTAHAYGIVAAVAFAANAEAFLAWTRGDDAGVLKALEVLDGRHGGGIGEPGILGYQVQSIDACITLRQLEQADDQLSLLEASARERQLPSVILDCFRLRGALANACGAHDEAECAFARGREIEEAVAIPFVRGMFHLADGHRLREGRQRREAAVALRRARDVLVQLGASPFVRRADEELALCGITASRTGGRPALSLSAHERAVARLLVQGRTNRQIAEVLVVSPKTVEYHLARMYIKLGVGNRTELAAELARRRLDDVS